MDISRRSFIKSAAALAALTAVPLLKTKEIEAQAAQRCIHGQTFYLKEPIVINLPGVTISQCRFVAVAPMSCMIDLSASHCMIVNCTFDTQEFADVAIQAIHMPQDCVISSNIITNSKGIGIKFNG